MRANRIRTHRIAWALAFACPSAEAAAADGAGASGLDLGFSYVSDVFADVAGGLREGATVMGKADLTATYRGRLLGVGDSTAFVDLQFVHGRSLSGHYVGDAQTVSNIDAVGALRPFEAWIRLPFALAGAEGSVTTGLVDLNGIFDVQDVGRIFLNSSHGIGPDFSQTGRNGPSIFPTTAPAFAIALGRDGWEGRLGLFEGVAGDPAHPRRTVIRAPGQGGVLMVGELIRKVGSGELQLGAWTYTSRFEALAPADPHRRIGGNRGAYALAEGRLLGREDRPHLAAWGRIGIARARINPIGVYFGGGASYGVEGNRVGLAVAHAQLGDPGYDALAAAGPRPRRAETAVELTWIRRVTPWLRVHPDVQYVIHPGWRREAGDALVAGIRLVFEPF